MHFIVYTLHNNANLFKDKTTILLSSTLKIRIDLTEIWQKRENTSYLLKKKSAF